MRSEVNKQLYVLQERRKNDMIEYGFFYASKQNITFFFSNLGFPSQTNSGGIYFTHLFTC